MNVPNIQRVRDLIASQPPEALKMDSWFSDENHFSYVYSDDEDAGLIGLRVPEHNCGTAACIGGWAVTQMARDLGVTVIPTVTGVGSTAAEYLGLDPTQSDRLFHPSNLSERTQAEALATLDHLIATGEVQWGR